MGMYTEIIFGAELKRDTPKNIIDIIQKLVDGNEEEVEEIINHPFFFDERIWFMNSAGAYFIDPYPPRFTYNEYTKSWTLHFRTSIKNYSGTINKFLDWIKPYISYGSGTNNFYAIVTNEQEKEPKIYYLIEE